MKIRSALILICVMTFILSLCACDSRSADAGSVAESSEKTALDLIDVEEYASKGEIYGCEFPLGTSPEEIKTAYHYGESVQLQSEATSESEDQQTESEAETMFEGEISELTVVEGDTVKLITGSAKYYYRSQLAESGVAYIACFDDPFSYYVGLTTKDEILRTIHAEPVYNDAAQPEDLFFFYGTPENVWEIRYQFGEYVLSFFFEGENLSVTTIYHAPRWTEFTSAS